jgi:integrase
MAVARRSFGYVRKLPSARYQASYIGPDGGRHTALSTFSRKSDASDWLATVQADIARGDWVSPDEQRQAASARAASAARATLTFREWSGEWLASLPRLNRSPKTIQTHTYRMKRLLDAFGDRPLASITEVEVQRWYDAVMAEAGRGVVRPTYMTLSTCLSAAVRAHHLDASPCHVPEGQRHVPLRPRERRQVATPSEVKAAADAMPVDLRLAVLLAAWCQLREGEVIGLKRHDFDLERGTVHVRRQIQYLTDLGPDEESPKSAAGDRVLTIPETLMPEVVRHLETFSAPGEYGLVFHRAGQPSVPIHPNTLRGAWNRARVGVPGLEEFVFHDLRHTGLTIFAQNGATFAELLHRGGHSSLEVALRYQHATEERDRSLTAQMDQQVVV